MIETVIHHSQISVASCQSWLTSGNPHPTTSVLPQKAVGLMVGHNHGRNRLLDTNKKKKTTHRRRWKVPTEDDASVIRFAPQDMKTKPSCSVCQTLAPRDFTALGKKAVLQSKSPVRLSKAVQFLHYRAVIKQRSGRVPLKPTVIGNSHLGIY